MGDQDDPTTEEPRRAAAAGMWGSVAHAWEAEADFVDARAGAATTALLDAVDVAPGQRVLELACGAGGVGLAAAVRVGEEGEVVLSDLTPAMVEAAQRRAAAMGITSVRTAVRDLEAIDEPDASFDVVLCRDGLMFAQDPARAAAEIRRVLRPGGRAGLTAWGPRRDNPWLGVLFDAVTDVTGMPVPPPGIPGPFALDDPDRFRGVLLAGGFVAVEVESVEVPWLAASFEDWWDRTTALAGPIAAVLAGLPVEVVTAIKAFAETAIDAYRAGHGFDLPGVSLVAAAR